MKVVWKTFRELLPWLPGDAQSYLWRYVVVSCLLAILDIAAIMLLALSLAPMISGASINFPVVGRLGPDAYVWVVGAVAFLILAKSVLAIGQQWFATRKFATFELEIGRRLFDAYIKAPWTHRLARNTAQLVRIADVGIANATSGFLLPIVQLPGLVVSFVTILIILVIAQPLTALITVAYLGAIMALLYWVVSGKSVQAGRVSRDYSLKVASLMTEMVQALKEITLRNKASEVADVVNYNRSFSTKARANMNFLGSLPSFVLNAALVGGFVLVGTVGYLTGGLQSALASVALFAVAGFRLIPALTGFQSIVTTTTANVPHVQAVIFDIKASQIHVDAAEKLGRDPIVGSPKVLRFDDVSFAYPGHEDAPALHDIDLEIPIGSSLAFVGSSGAGKSTMIDVLLGLLVPQQGTINARRQEPRRRAGRLAFARRLRAAGRRALRRHDRAERRARLGGRRDRLRQGAHRARAGAALGCRSRLRAAACADASASAASRSRAVSGSGSASPARSTATRSCSCSTRRRARSTRRPNRS